MIETLGALMNSKNTLKLIQEDSVRASILGNPIHTLGGDRIQINDNVYDLTPEIKKLHLLHHTLVRLWKMNMIY